MISRQEIKISQYSDKTTLNLNGSNASYTTALQILNLFSDIPELRLNHRKKWRLCGITLTLKKKKISTQKKVSNGWNTKLELSTNPKTTAEANYSETLGIAPSKLTRWNCCIQSYCLSTCLYYVAFANKPQRYRRDK